MFLPFSHVYGLMVQVLCLRGGLLMGHEPELRADVLAESLLTFRPTYLCAVPFVFEKLYKTPSAPPSRRAGEPCSSGPCARRRTTPWRRSAAAGHGPDPVST